MGNDMISTAMAVVVGIVVIGATLLTGLVVMDSLGSGLNIDDNSTFSQTMDDTEDAINVAFGLIGVLILIIVAVAILSALMYLMRI